MHGCSYVTARIQTYLNWVHPMSVSKFVWPFRGTHIVFQRFSYNKKTTTIRYLIKTLVNIVNHFQRNFKYSNFIPLYKDEIFTVYEILFLKSNLSMSYIIVSILYTNKIFRIWSILYSGLKIFIELSVNVKNKDSFERFQGLLRCQLKNRAFYSLEEDLSL